MKRCLPLLLLLLLFASPADDCARQQAAAPGPLAMCEPWLNLPDGTVSVCITEDAWTFEMSR